MRTVHDEDESDVDVDDVDDQVDDDVDGETDGGDDGDDEEGNDGDDEKGVDEEGENEENEKTIWDIYKERAANAAKATEEDVTLPDIRKYVIKKYITDVLYYNKFRRDSAHKQITATKRKFLDDANEDEKLGDYEALKLSVAKRQHLIDEVTGLESDDDNENNESDAETDA